MTVDPYRHIDYLRLSITDRCNLRCTYCIPAEGIQTFPHRELLSFEEIVRVCRIFANLGIRKIRLTGGEPLVRKGMISLIEDLAEIEGIQELSLTTNGVFLPLYAQRLREAGLKGINISLDTLDTKKFKMITGWDALSNVLDGIDESRKAGFHKLKLNVVVMRGVNDDEIIKFIDFALSKGLILRFIEFMDVSPLWKEDCFISSEEIKTVCEEKFRLERTQEDLGGGPAAYYTIEGNFFLGFIKTAKENCMVCSRLRLTSMGKLKICLYEASGICLKTLLRNGAPDNEIQHIIQSRLRMKPSIDYQSWPFQGRAEKVYMCSVGG